MPRTLTAEQWYNRGYELKRAGDASGALHAFRESIKLNAHVAAPWIGLAQLLEANNQLEDARQCLLRAVNADPQDSLARRLLASSHQALGFVVEARREFQLSLKLDPDSAPAYFGLGQLLEDLGEPQQAAEAYRRAVSLDPEKPAALASLLGLSRQVDVSSEIDQASRTLPQLTPGDKALLAYGLGKAYEQQENYAAAFQAYETANRARQAIAGRFDRRRFDARLEKMITIFSADFFSARQSWGDSSERPVFIVGLPRSGTTLTEQVVGSHPECFGAGELNTLTDLATGTPDRLGIADPPWPDCAVRLGERQIADLGKEYVARASIRAPAEAHRVVDKQPLNFWHLGLVAMALPNARIIHCTRDIRDCGLSIYTHNFNHQQAWSTDLDDIAYYWRGYRKLMEHWAKVTGLRIVEARYEETVSSLKVSAEGLLKFLGLPWNDNVLSFHQNDRAVQTPSRWQVRQPVYQTSMARWTRYEKQLTPLVKAAACPVAP
ncbi:MAG: sulfotransferase [Pseudomonadota bacterium]